MATLTVRDVDDDVMARLANEARRNSTSVAAEVRHILAERDKEQRSKILIAEMRAFAERNPLRLPDGVTMLDLLREERDSW